MQYQVIFDISNYWTEFSRQKLLPLHSRTFAP